MRLPKQIQRTKQGMAKVRTLGNINTEETDRERKASERGRKKAFIEGKGNSGKSSVLEAKVREGFKE